ncbi:hypothetical protein [Brevundimonas sp.]|jgi:hypothetical protein|uniref:hypothetical protein n=1 Tax=Brevundimonas sp. TaxID=1871086 RepID=UPI003783FD49
MFEFSRDLRKLFAQARESEDLSWLELIGVDLLASEARGQSTDAGRVSCAKPHLAWLRASALWREHARRSGAADSVTRAMGAAIDAARAAKSIDEIARAGVERASILLLRFDLSGGRDVLDQAAEAVPGASAVKPATAALISAVHARIRSRLARFDSDAGALMQAAALLDAAIHQMERTRAGATDDIRMDRAALALEAGVTRRDPHLLDQAGRELLRLVEGASPDYRPLTRARALTLCGAGLSALAALAGNEPAREQGRIMFEAAADQFTPDHSPLDWATIQIVRGGQTGAVSLAALRQADALTAGQGLVLGALARDMLIEGEVAAASSIGDLPRLTTAESAVRRRLSDTPASDLDWAVDQIAMARIAQARALLTGGDASLTGLALIEAAEVARERGLPALAARADAMMRSRSVRA